MKLHNPDAVILVPDQSPVDTALSRTTHMALAAHPDDVEIMALHGILSCFANPDAWFTGVVTTDGAGSPRSGPYAHVSDRDMIRLRREEQWKSAVIGDYSACAMLDYPSKVVKTDPEEQVVNDMVQLLLACRPRVVYTHNPADKHPTHIATFQRVLEALRRLPEDARPEQVLGCEAWRDLDWMPDSDKVILDVSGLPHIANAVLAAHDSQITGGKQYGLAMEGRRRAHATFSQSHATDDASGVSIAMDLTPLMLDPTLSPFAYVQGMLRKLESKIAETLAQSERA